MGKVATRFLAPSMEMRSAGIRVRRGEEADPLGVGAQGLKRSRLLGAPS